MLRDLTSSDATRLRSARSWRRDEAISRWAELLAAFFLVPLLVGLWVPPSWWLPCLWVIAGLSYWHLRHEGLAGFPWVGATRQPRPSRRATAYVLCRFAVLSGLLALCLILTMPERLFDFPRQRTVLWLAILVLYPVLSVYPQELLYRRYFFHRFGGLVSPSQLLALSALSFGWMHLIFRNEHALLMTLVGGGLFADTYRRTGSLRLVCLEHALYGQLVFTIGLGEYIYHGIVPEAGG